MKAFRNVGGSVVEIVVDLDLEGNPILPPDTTVDPKPEALEGHYVTVVDKAWVQIPVPVEFKAFETKKADVLAKWSAYREWSLEQPVTYMELEFDGDEQARIRVSQALAIATATGVVPAEWVTKDNGSFALATIEDLKALVTAIFTPFQERFYAANEIRKQILAAADEAALELIEVPVIPNNM